ncbi:MAG: CoA pyrophosphatase [Myxococcota bacterium]|nr:CoA pyrophosphatase [Myxococcota bacterium]
MDPDRIEEALRPTLGDEDADQGPGGLPRAAVAAILRGGERDTELLFIRRSEHPDDPWSGHMAFPGGRVEPPESLRAAVEREVSEEVGLDLGASGRLVGRLLVQHSPTVPMEITPYVYVLESPVTLRLNQEVASIHWFSMDRLRRGEGRDTFPYPYQGRQVELPCVRMDGCFLWGLTLRMTDDLLARLPG